MERARKRPDETSRTADAARLGLGTTAGLAGYQGLAATIRDRMQDSAVSKSRSYTDFLGKLQPGDIVFHRRPSKYSAPAEYEGRKFPLSEADVMIGAKGDTYYHPSIYRGKGVITEAGGIDKGVKNSRLRGPYPEELRVYRPKNGGDAARADRFAQTMLGSEYKETGDMIKHGAAHLLGAGGPRTAGKRCAIGPEGVVCSELVAEAYPRIFKDRYMSPKDMRHSKDVELVARYGRAAPTTVREALLAKGVYPVLKNAKWGALAGAAGLAGMTLSDYFRGDDNAQRA